MVYIYLFYFVDAAAKRFLEQPRDELVSQGQVHIIRCVLADQLGTVQWLRDGFGLGPGPVFEGYPRYRVLENNALGLLRVFILSFPANCRSSRMECSYYRFQPTAVAVGWNHRSIYCVGY